MINYTKIISMSVTPKQIIEAIEAVPPYHQDAIKKSYKGIKVKWELEFISIFKTSGINKFTVLAGSPDVLNAIQFDIDIAQYPWFKILKEKEKITIEGIIVRAFYDGAMEIKPTKVYKQDNELAENNINITDNLDQNTIVSREKKWWEQTYIQILFVIGAIASVVGVLLFFWFKK